MHPEIASFGPFEVGPYAVGPFTLYWFGAMMGLGFLVAAELTGRELRRRGYDAKLASVFLLAAAGGGLLGSRLWAVANEWRLFLADPLLAIFSGAGFVWYGGLIGGGAAVTLAFRRHGIPWLRGADCVAPGLALGQAIGRIGCHLAGDGDWGVVTELPWGVAYSEALIGWPHPPGVVVHPTPLYEMAAYTLVFALLWSVRGRSRADGEIFALYLLTAPAARFAIELVRVNPPVLLGLSQAQLFSIALVLAGAVLLAVLRSRQSEAPVASPRPAVAGR